MRPQLFYEKKGLRSFRGVSQGPFSLICAIHTALLHSQKVTLSRRYKLENDTDYSKITDIEDLAQYRAVLSQLKKTGKNENFQIEEAKKRMTTLGISHNVGFDDLESVQKRIYAKIFVFQCHRKHNETRQIFLGKSPAYAAIYLLCDPEQIKFGVCTAPGGLVKGKYLCRACGKASKEKSRHICSATCNLCGERFSSSCYVGDLYPCAGCNRVFRSYSCLLTHRKPNANGTGSRCTAIHSCSDCGLLYRTDHPHDCEAPDYCPTCMRKVKRETHQCTWPIFTEEDCEKQQKAGDVFGYCAYDFECIQNVIFGSYGDPDVEYQPRHYVNLAVLRKFCNDCQYESPEEHCNRCSPKVLVFKRETAGEDQEAVIDRFCDYIIKDPTMIERILIAHNSSNYDMHFIVKNSLRKKYKITFVNKGLRIVVGETKGKGINHLIFRDSYLHLPFALSAWPKLFDLETTEKGTFPVLYNTEENWGKVLPTLPEKKYFSYDFMSTEQQEKFNKWYEEEVKKKEPFDINARLEEYCRTDVNILTEGLIRFRDEMRKMTGFDPMQTANTLSSMSLFLIRALFLREDAAKLPHLREAGYGSVRQSEMAMKYIRWLEWKGRRLQHKFSPEGEKKVEIDGHTYSLDAYDLDTGEAIEINGCLSHGCSICFSPDAKIFEETAQQINDRTAERKKRLETVMPVIEVWEHEIEDLLNQDREFREFYDTCKVVTRLTGRDSLLGGRVECHRSFAKSSLEKEIRVFDIVSLYPSVFSMEKYPLGHPTVITQFTEEEKGTLPFEGIVKCRVLPPRDLALPVLGISVCEGLYFVNCYTCLIKRHSNCTHEKEDDRALTGTWCTVELKLALSRGYRILELYEAYHWDEWSDTLYRDYVKMFLKGKYAASGFPVHIVTQQEKKDYCRRVGASLGFDLQPEEVVFNSARRTLCKLYLNVTWGKLGQRVDFSTTQFLESYEFNRLVRDTTRVLTYWEITEDHVHYVKHRPRKETIFCNRFSAVHHAALTTSYSRVKMYKFLEIAHKMGGLLYTDTDSVMIEYPRGQNPLAEFVTDEFGELSDDIKGNLIIQEMIVTGCKSYSMRLVDRNTGEIFYKKANKGFFRSAEADSKITHERMKQMVFNRSEKGTEKVKYLQFDKPRIGEIRTKEVVKTFSAKSEKKLIRGEGEGEYYVPYGYVPSAEKE